LPLDRRRDCAALLLALACALSGCAAARESGARTTDAEAEVRAALAAWPRDFAAQRTAAVCGLFAPDAVLSYPGSSDRTYADACAQFSALFAAPDRHFAYAPPEIEQVLVDRDTVVVRLIWTLTVTDASGRTLEVVREKGVDVFRRQADGAWRIRVSHAYPL
jgi:uncharacterized protein (TIGR02246 family)